MADFVDSTLTKLTDLSLEFLMGRALDNAMLNVGMKDVARGRSRGLTVKALLLSHAQRV
jgi:glucan phosphorylase